MEGGMGRGLEQNRVGSKAEQGAEQEAERGAEQEEADGSRGSVGSAVSVLGRHGDRIRRGWEQRSEGAETGLRIMKSSGEVFEEGVGVQAFRGLEREQSVYVAQPIQSISTNESWQSQSNSHHVPKSRHISFPGLTRQHEALDTRSHY